ncbi:hypothetical protein P615_10030 [Brevibacillus laterosporus PE36]|nr:hypothetical protein P615_10030 [Brevibacillus laterosporus PE36]
MKIIFYISKREREVAIEKGDSYQLVLVENVTYESINIFKRINNPMNIIVNLEPIAYKGRIRRE